MKIHQDDIGSLVIELTQSEGKTLARKIIQHAKDAHSTELNFGYLINEARFGAINSFHQPPKSLGAA